MCFLGQSLLGRKSTTSGKAPSLLGFFQGKRGPQASVFCFFGCRWLVFDGGLSPQVFSPWPLEIFSFVAVNFFGEDDSPTSSSSATDILKLHQLEQRGPALVYETIANSSAMTVWAIAVCTGKATPLCNTPKGVALILRILQCSQDPSPQRPREKQRFARNKRHAFRTTSTNVQ